MPGAACSDCHCTFLYNEMKPHVELKIERYAVGDDDAALPPSSRMIQPRLRGCGPMALWASSAPTGAARQIGFAGVLRRAARPLAAAMTASVSTAAWGQAALRRNTTNPNLNDTAIFNFPFSIFHFLINPGEAAPWPRGGGRSWRRQRSGRPGCGWSAGQGHIGPWGACRS